MARTGDGPARLPGTVACQPIQPSPPPGPVRDRWRAGAGVQVAGLYGAQRAEIFWALSLFLSPQCNYIPHRRERWEERDYYPLRYKHIHTL